MFFLFVLLIALTSKLTGVCCMFDFGFSKISWPVELNIRTVLTDDTSNLQRLQLTTYLLIYLLSGIIKEDLFWFKAKQKW